MIPPLASKQSLTVTAQVRVPGAGALVTSLPSNNCQEEKKKRKKEKICSLSYHVGSDAVGLVLNATSFQPCLCKSFEVDSKKKGACVCFFFNF